MPESTPSVCLYIATSLDGYIATPDGGVAWLDPYYGEDLGFDRFMDTFDSRVLGRTSYDQEVGFGVWPYEGKRSVVLTSSPLRVVRPGAEAWTGTPDALVAAVRRGDLGRVWLVGGAKTVELFLRHDAVDRMELGVIPVILGQGIPLYPRLVTPLDFELVETRQLPRNLVGLTYRRKRG